MRMRLIIERILPGRQILFRALRRSSCHWGRGWLGGRQPDPEVAALPWLGIDADLAAHHVHHPFRDRQAQPESLLVERAGATVETLEDAVDLIGWDAGSGVSDLDQHVGGASATRAKRNGARRRRVLKRVRKQAD